MLCVTLKVEFCAGYAGVMIFMSWNRSDLFTRSSHTRRPWPSSTIGVSITGVVHCHASQSWKKLYTSMLGAALGYSWQTLATRMAKFTPPKYPSTLLYTPRPFAQTRSARSAVRNASWFGTSLRSWSATRHPLRDLTLASSRFWRMLVWHTSRSSGTLTKLGRLAYAMSTSKPRKMSLSSGTTASGTATILSVPGWCFMTS